MHSCNSNIFPGGGCSLRIITYYDFSDRPQDYFRQGWLRSPNECTRPSHCSRRFRGEQLQHKLTLSWVRETRSRHHQWRHQCVLVYPSHIRALIFDRRERFFHRQSISHPHDPSFSPAQKFDHDLGSSHVQRASSLRAFRHCQLRSAFASMAIFSRARSSAPGISARSMILRSGPQRRPSYRPVVYATMTHGLFFTVKSPSPPTSVLYPTFYSTSSAQTDGRFCAVSQSALARSHTFPAFLLSRQSYHHCRTWR